ncbi:MAG: DUF4058 family protein [Planctomycetes bacterium]|nr:DUF4058 family protein [Planctomycetota bacterium]
MPVHDWTRVGAGIFHDFHHTWITEIKRSLNAGLLPEGVYALAEQITSGWGPDVLTLEAPANAPKVPKTAIRGVAVMDAPPRVRFHAKGEIDQYAAKAKAVTIRHSSNHKVLAILEIVSPGNKDSRHGIRSFVDKAYEIMRAGVHLLVVDLFPPGLRDPEGIHKLIWTEWQDNDFALPADKCLTLASYIGGPIPEAFVEPVAVGGELLDMPLFLTPDEYVSTPLEATYRAAWEAVPAYWREVLATPH